MFTLNIYLKSLQRICKEILKKNFFLTSFFRTFILRLERVDFCFPATNIINSHQPSCETFPFYFVTPVAFVVCGLRTGVVDEAVGVSLKANWYATSNAWPSVNIISVAKSWMRKKIAKFFFHCLSPKPIVLKILTILSALKTWQ